ncbi:MAG: adenylyltransferase [Alphaproteobacteria bacterium]|nr:MAG: adenylyltransferase [Alphaproteobacteria bacterium]
MDGLFAGYMAALGQTEWLPKQKLEQYQRSLVARVVRHAYDNVPFYRERLACLIGADGAVDLARWDEVPVLRRKEAAADSARMRVTQLPDYYGPIVDYATTGSSGVPLDFSANGMVLTTSNAGLTRLAAWFGADTSKPLARIRVYRDAEEIRYPEGATSKGWSRASPEAEVYDLDLLTPTDRQLEWLMRRRAPYLMSSASNLAGIAHIMSPAQARALNIKLVFGIAETITAHAREIVAQRMGARIAGIYSCQEVGHIAHECPQHGHYHVFAENMLVEILDDASRPTPPGELGQVVLTSLYNYATPFIRYAIGDVAVRSDEPCPCGRALPVLAEVHGRTRSGFLFRDGTRVWPRFWHARKMRAFVPFREFQLVQTDFETVEFRYVPDEKESPADFAGLRNFIATHLHASVTTRIIAVPEVEKGPGGKFEHFISLVTPPRA